MFLGKIWQAIAAQFNKLANAIRGYDPIAEMQLEYDRSVDQIREGREGLAQYRAMVERVLRQVEGARKQVATVEARIKAYLTAGDRETAGRLALDLKRAKDDLAENEKQLGTARAGLPEQPAEDPARRQEARRGQAQDRQV